MAEAEDYYDVIIVDCSDPIGPGEGLFTEEFYKNTLKALKADGLFVQQTESPMLHQPLVEKVFGYVIITSQLLVYIQLLFHCIQQVCIALHWDPKHLIH